MNITYSDLDFKACLIKRYRCYDLTELDVMVFFVADDILQAQPDALLTCDILSNYMIASKDDIDQSLSKLIKKNILQVKKDDHNSLYSSVEDFKKKLFDDVIKDFILMDKVGANNPSDPTDLLNSLEELQGRTLSPIERDMVTSWLKQGCDDGMIKEACHKALTKRGTISFKEADTLLLEMKRSQSRQSIGVSTVNEDTKKKEELRDLFANSDWTYHGEK